MLKRWPKVETVRFTNISAFEKHLWLRNRCTNNFKRDIFYQFKDLKDFQKAWNTEILKEVSLSELMEDRTQLITSKEKPKHILKCVGDEGLHRRLVIDVIKIQYDYINVTKYDAIRDIRMFTPRKETLKFMAKQMKKLEHLQMKIGFGNPGESLLKDWQKAFCDFLKSQEQTLKEITFLFPCLTCHGNLSEYPHPISIEKILDCTKFIYESIKQHCPNLNTININWLERRNEFFPYPMVGAWKNFKITTVSVEHNRAVECFF